MSKILTPETRTLVVFISGSSHGLFNNIRIRLDPCSLTLFKNFVRKIFLPLIKRGSWTYNVWMQETTQRTIKLLGLLLPISWSRNARTRRHSKCYKTKLIARPVLYSAANDPRPREWSPDRKWSPNWTANDTEPQMIPNVDCKWSRRKTRNGMESIPPFEVSIYNINRSKS